MRLLKFKLFKRRWRKLNKHNYTKCRNVFPLEIVSVGKHTYGDLHVHVWDENVEKLTIGSYCSIANDVKFVLGGNHLYRSISTYPFKVMLHQQSIVEALSKGEVVVEDDVWIGMHTIILSGVRIGKGAVVAAGSVVTRDVEPYSIVGGNPAKLIKKRFDDNIIKELMEINFDEIDFQNIAVDELYKPLVSIEQLEILKDK